jgi:hypothetical protein
MLGFLCTKKNEVRVSIMKITLLSKIRVKINIVKSKRIRLPTYKYKR